MDRSKPKSAVSVTRLLGLFAVVVGLLLVLLTAYLTWNSIQERLDLQQADAEIKIQATQMADRLRSVQFVLAQPDVAEQAWRQLDGGADQDQLLAVLSANGVRNVLNVVIAPEPIEATDLSRLPGSGFAALDMLVTARDEGAAPAQVHFAGTADEYVAFSQRVERPTEQDVSTGEESEPSSVEETEASPSAMSSVETESANDVFTEEDQAGPQAVVFIGLPVSVVANQIQMPEGVDGLALVQTGSGQLFRLRSLGRTVPVSAESVPVPGSLFELQWYRSSVIGPLSWIQLGAVALSGLLLAVLGVLVLRRNPLENDPAVSQPAAERAIDDSAPQASTDKTSVKHAQSVLPMPGIPAKLPSKPTAQPPIKSPIDPTVDDAISDDVGGAEAEADRSDELLLDGEVRRASQKQQILDAPELINNPDNDVDPQGFDPDAPADEPGELNEMLKSLMNEETAPAITLEPAVQINPDSDKHEQLSVPLASIFRAYDIRGIVGETLDEAKAYAIGRAIGSEAVDRGINQICIARDGRLSGAAMLAATSRGLMASGLEVIDVGAVATPVLYFAASELSGGSGVMITGSHNPPDYNGFKIMLAGETLSGEAITDLHKRLVDKNLHEGEGESRTHRIAVQYIERISTDIQLRRPLKVVADCGNGIAGNIAPKLLSAIGADVIPLYAEVDGTFPNHHPDPGDPTTLEDLKLCVRNFNADLGIAFDGDGDRLGVVTAAGEIVYPDRVMMLFAQDVLSRNPGAPIIFDVKCSGLLAQVIEQAGGQPIMSRTGHSFIKQRLKAEQAPLAGEMSGHFFFAERWYGFDDGMYAAARLLEILASDERDLGQILAELPSAESTPELKVQMQEGEPHAFIKAFAEQAEFEGAQINTIDGLRADFEDGWGLVRASNTTPVLVIRFEGGDVKALARIKEVFRKQILNINPELKLPF